MEEEKKLPRWLIMFLVVFIVVAFIVGVVVGIIIWSIVFNKAPEQSQDLYTIHLGLLQFYLAFVAVVVTVLVVILAWKIGDVERRAECAVKTAEEAANKAVDKLSKTMRKELEASSVFSMGWMTSKLDGHLKEYKQSSAKPMQIIKDEAGKTKSESPLAYDITPVFKDTTEDYFTKAERLWQELCDDTEDNKEKAKYQLMIADIDFERKNWHECIRKCDLAIGFDRMNIDAYINRGYAYACILEYQKAIEEFSKVMNICECSNVSKDNVLYAIAYNNNLSFMKSFYKNKTTPLEKKEELKEQLDHYFENEPEYVKNDREQHELYARMRQRWAETKSSEVPSS